MAINSINQKKWSEIFTKKVGNLLYLYLLWGGIQWLFIKGIITNISNQELSDSVNSAYSKDIIEFFFNLATALTSLWYLYALAGYFVIAKIFRNEKEKLIIFSFALNYLAAFGYFPGWGLTSLAQNMIFFLLGVFFSSAIIKLSRFKKENYLIWIAILALVILNVYIGVYKNLFTSLMAIVLSIIVCDVLNSIVNMSWLNWIGRNTLQIYVIHRIYIEILGLSVLTIGVGFHFFDNKLFSFSYSAFFPLVAVVVCTLASIVTWKIINRGFGRSLFAYPSIISQK
ncbi:acyltransferase family protein [Klebsiella quasipneumoniae]|uniref:acyltransferase family protein n=1 Tax=Klebsiella quasipneumoniae TaxID=1463165 RepID=UPI002815B669|nr:acyltransferase family protein [Klebsiella quasipneumoniae]